jgi:hypothetical protein
MSVKLGGENKDKYEVPIIMYDILFRRRDVLYRHSNGKGKAIPLQALTDPEGSRSFNLPDFKTIGT